MTHDPVKIQETTSWFHKARNDLRAAKVDMDATPPLVEDALFHCQQAVEKAMKGFLAWHDQPFRKTHSLIELGVQCASLNPELESHLREAAKLSEYATKFRYPGDTTSATPEEAEQASALARDLLDRLLSLLPVEVLSRLSGGLGL